MRRERWGQSVHRTWEARPCKWTSLPSCGAVGDVLEDLGFLFDDDGDARGAELHGGIDSS